MDNLFIEPLSLPENRTEDEHLGLLRWLDMTTQTEVRRIGAHIDESGVERGVWQYTFTPEIEAVLPDLTAVTGYSYNYLGTLLKHTIAAYANDPDTIYVSPRRMNQIRRDVARGRRFERARKRAKRQRRAAQRRYNRGMR